MVRLGPYADAPQTHLSDTTTVNPTALAADYGPTATDHDPSTTDGTDMTAIGLGGGAGLLLAGVVLLLAWAASD